MRFGPLGLIIVLAVIAMMLLAGCGPTAAATIDTVKAKPQMLAPYWPPARVWLAGSCTSDKGSGKCIRPKPRKCRGRFCV